MNRSLIIVFLLAACYAQTAESFFLFDWINTAKNWIVGLFAGSANDPVKTQTLKDRIKELLKKNSDNVKCAMKGRYIMNITNLKPLMGEWWETYKYVDQENSTNLVVCEQCDYKFSNETYFLKKALVYIKTADKWIPVYGSGKLVAPGIVRIAWKNLRTGEPDSLLYMIIGTDYTSYLVGYTCETGAQRPEVVIQTRERNPSKETMETAINSIVQAQLPLQWLGCLGDDE